MGAWVTIKRSDEYINATWARDEYVHDMANYGQCEAEARHYLTAWLDNLGEDTTPREVRGVQRALDYLTSAGNYPGEYADGEARSVGPWILTVGVDGYLTDETTVSLRAHTAAQRQARA